MNFAHARGKEWLLSWEERFNQGISPFPSVCRYMDTMNSFERFQFD
jgi:hypothetical protein